MSISGAPQSAVLSRSRRGGPVLLSMLSSHALSGSDRTDSKLHSGVVGTSASGLSAESQLLTRLESIYDARRTWAQRPLGARHLFRI